MAQSTLASVLSAAPSLSRSMTEPRSVRNTLLTAGAWAVALVAAVPLISVLYMLIMKGGSRLGLELFTELPPAGFELDGGFGNAIMGTLVMVGIACLIAIPMGLMAAIYLAETGDPVPSSGLGVRDADGGGHAAARPRLDAQRLPLAEFRGKARREIAQAGPIRRLGRPVRP